MIASLALAAEAMTRDVKPFRAKPSTVVLNFLEAVDVGSKEYLSYIDLDLFVQSNQNRFKGCEGTQVKQFVNELVMLPVRHNPPLSGKFTERNTYQLTEEITDYQSAKVSLVKTAQDKKELDVRFHLVAKADKWIIANMEGYFDKHIAEACAKARSQKNKGGLHSE